jgi:AcrR family transcriptional regulator
VTIGRTVEAVQTKADRTRQRILDVAAAHYAEHGYAGTSLRKIATAAGLQSGSVYFHFASKEELIAEVLRDGPTRALAEVKAAVTALPEAGASDHIRAAARAHLNLLRTSADSGAALVHPRGGLPDQLRQAQADHARRYTGYWTRLIRAAQAEGTIDPTLNARAVRDIILAALNSTSLTGDTRPAYIDQVAETVLHLVLARR